MPEAAPPPDTACIVIDCEEQATLYVQVVDATTVSDEENSIAMCDEHADHWRAGDPG